MDKFEYKVRAEEIKKLIDQGEYVQAAEIADTIDWRRVKSVMMLCTISDLYKINRRYEDARDMLLLAYERRPGGRNICYSLCELSIKTGEFVQAMEYYKEFVQVAPRDPGRYILQYKLYEDQDVSLEERIEVLEELKRHDYREKWAYELAYLYHRVGLATRCVEECDEMILWFGEGDYVIKAMELKMLHQPLSPEQQEKYDHRFDQPVEEPAENAEYVAEDATVAGEAQAVENVDPLLGQTREFGVDPSAISVGGDTQVYQPVREMDLEQVNYAEDGYVQEDAVQTEVFVEEDEELDIHVKTMDVSRYNTMNLQAELAQELRELLGEEAARQAGDQEVAREIFLHDEESETAEEQMIEDPITRSIMAPMMGADTESLDYPEIDEVSEEDLEPEPELMEDSEVFFGETGEIELDQIRQEERTVGEIVEALPEDYGQEPQEEEFAEEAFADGEGEQLVMEEISSMPVTGMTARMTVIEPPKEMASVLTQGTDGQISLVVPEEEKVVEKQITGQMNIEDILAEWERWKKDNKEKKQEEVRQRVLQHTGSMFTEFEASVRDGLLEQLEKGEMEADPLTTEDEVEEIEEIAEVAEETESEDVREFVMLGETSIAAALAAAEAAEAEVAEETDDATEEAVEETEELEEIEEVEESEADESIAAGEAVESEETVEPEVTEAYEDEAYEDENVTEDADQAAAAGPEQNGSVREMSKDELELYGAFIQHRSTEEQIVRAVDNITLAAYTGNVIITAEAGMDTIALAKCMIREVQATDSNFSGKVAKISGQGISRKDVSDTLSQLQNGALIIQDACDMTEETAQNLYKALQNENLGIIVILTDDLKVMNRYLKGNEYLLDVFTARVDMKALTNDMLVAFGKQYAKEQEYAIDELGLLALHNRIENRQTIDHAVTTTEVQELVDNAIRHANRKTPGHFFSILLSKRYDEEDMIIITEKDFV